MGAVTGSVGSSAAISPAKHRPLFFNLGLTAKTRDDSPPPDHDDDEFEFEYSDDDREMFVDDEKRFTSDDEDDFGEDLPEDVGGTVSELANDQHEALADPYGEVSTGADDSEAAAVATEGEPETVLEATTIDSAYTSNDRLISPLTSARSPATDAPHGNPTKIAGGAELTTGGTQLTFSRV